MDFTTASTPCQSAENGLHGDGSNFMPLVQLQSEDIAPRIVQIAGIYPGITADEFMAPQSSPVAPLGEHTHASVSARAWTKFGCLGTVTQRYSATSCSRFLSLRIPLPHASCFAQACGSLTFRTQTGRRWARLPWPPPTHCSWPGTRWCL